MRNRKQPRDSHSAPQHTRQIPAAERVAAVARSRGCTRRHCSAREVGPAAMPAVLVGRAVLSWSACAGDLMIDPILPVRAQSIFIYNLRSIIYSVPRSRARRQRPASPQAGLISPTLIRQTYFLRESFHLEATAFGVAPCRGSGLGSSPFPVRHCRNRAPLWGWPRSMNWARVS